MTRILSDILQAAEPHFQMQLRQLERISGHRGTDITLSVEVTQSTKQKVHDLGLDRHDTTAQELYHVLHQRLADDDKRLERALRTQAAKHISAEANIMDGLIHVLQSEARHIHGFGIKTAVLKRQLQKMPPKRVVKQLGYRSLDALLRAESPAAVIAAAQVIESAAWRRDWLTGYKQLAASDFESCTPAIVHPGGKRWVAITQKMLAEKRHTVLSLPEINAIIILPLPADKPDGMVVATVALALHELNANAAASNYLRASQVHGDFSDRVRASAKGQIHFATPLLTQSMPWQLVQRYFATTNAEVNEDVFGPHVQSKDFQWHNVENVMASLCPSMEFWTGTSHLTLLHHGERVSLNLIDVAVNCCNQLAFEVRSVYHAQAELWSELTLRYLDHDSIEHAVAAVLQPKLALEPAVN